MVLEFGPFELDPGRRRLTRGGETVHLPDRQLSALVLLADRAGRIVSKHDLNDFAWRGVAVTDNAIVQAISSLRAALAGGPGDGPLIETCGHLGYRLAADVERVDPDAEVRDELIDRIKRGLTHDDPAYVNLLTSSSTDFSPTGIDVRPLTSCAAVDARPV